VLRPDPCLDSYRNRAAKVLDGDAVVMTLYARSDFIATRTGGRLWWRRYGEPAELLMLIGSGDGTDLHLDDWLVGDELTDALSQWALGLFRFRGHEFRLLWLDDDQSAAVRDEWQLS
jgi:hypothetical protein